MIKLTSCTRWRRIAQWTSKIIKPSMNPWQRLLQLSCCTGFLFSPSLLANPGTRTRSRGICRQRWRSGRSVRTRCCLNKSRRCCCTSETWGPIWSPIASASSVAWDHMCKCWYHCRHLCWAAIPHEHMWWLSYLHMPLYNWLIQFRKYLLCCVRSLFLVIISICVRVPAVLPWVASWVRHLQYTHVTWMKKQGTNNKPSFFSFLFWGFFSLVFLSNCRRTFSEVIVKGGGLYMKRIQIWSAAIKTVLQSFCIILRTRAQLYDKYEEFFFLWGVLVKTFLSCEFCNLLFSFKEVWYQKLNKESNNIRSHCRFDW